MADSIPQAYLKELADTLAAESLKVAFFTNLTGYTQATATTYAVLAGTATEVAAGNGYTTGGFALTLTSSNYSTTGAKVAATATTVTGSTYSFRYLVVYNSTSGKIRFVKDLLATKIATSGTVTITWDSTNGILKWSFTEA